MTHLIVFTYKITVALQKGHWTTDEGSLQWFSLKHTQKIIWLWGFWQMLRITKTFSFFLNQNKCFLLNLFIF